MRICSWTRSTSVHQLGHRVLDLDARVHLDEVELAVLVQELHGAGTAIADALAGVDAQQADGLALLGGNAGRGRFFDAPSGCAAASSSRARPGARRSRWQSASTCTSMWRGVSRYFSRNTAAVPERRRCLGARDLDLGDQFVLAAHHLHAAPATAGGGLDQHRVTDLLRHFLADDFVVRQHALGARHAGHAGGDHLGLGGGLAAHQPDGLGLAGR